jgi:uncharacterized protein YfdQ (DUF2303 family)
MADTKNTTVAVSISDFDVLAANLRQPQVIERESADDIILVPDGYRVEDLERLLPAPKRKTGTVTTTTVDSFIDVVKRYGSLASCNLYLDVDYSAQRVAATAIFNDHADGDGAPGWRDHRCVFRPIFSEEWKRWTAQDRKPIEQTKLAHFLEENVSDIRGGDGLPTGSDVLQFVSALAETRKVKYGSAVNLQNGMVQVEFVEEGDAGQRGKLEMFREFGIGLRPFQGGAAYLVRAFLRYRIDRNTGGITFWYELQRPDRVLEDACAETVQTIRTQTGMPVIFGTP